MLEYVAIAWAFCSVIAVAMSGVVAWIAVRRARPEDLPRILEICGHLLRGRNRDSLRRARTDSNP